MEAGVGTKHHLPALRQRHLRTPADGHSQANYQRLSTTTVPSRSICTSQCLSWNGGVCDTLVVWATVPIFLLLASRTSVLFCIGLLQGSRRDPVNLTSLSPCLSVLLAGSCRWQVDSKPHRLNTNRARKCALWSDTDRIPPSRHGSATGQSRPVKPRCHRSSPAGSRVTVWRATR